ncbi:LacI family DNA-binding transcriptional regulator [Alkalibacter saccharofermentans]|uniref:LacI family DNA-binding transcriptional regulator n=1 Tax=Alkalibacter saccharofermentans TaxID=235931 RepID=UPI00135646DE|nr:LacI family DNA-binding transcriptional regulator [Alkalibacter saccharofermentans]
MAKEAGVSRTTVSYVLNNVDSVSLKEETRDKVLKAANKLGYFPDNTAQALKTNKAMSIAVVSRRKIDEHRFVPILGGIQSVLSKAGYNILFCSEEKDKDGYPEYYRLFKSKKVDGLIFIAHQEQMKLEDIETRISLLKKDKIPNVFIDYHLNREDINSVDIDYFQGAYLMMRYIIDKKHKNIALIIPDTETEQEKQRVEGVKKAVYESGSARLTIYDKIFTFYDSDEEKSIDKIRNIIKRQKESAIIAAWAHVGLCVISEANRNKMEIPNEIAVAALASSGFERFLYPSMTSIELPMRELGEKASHMILSNLADANICEQSKIPCKIIEMESV